MKSIILLLLAALLSAASAAVLPNSHHNTDLAATNATFDLISLRLDTVFDFNPEPFGAVCGTTWEVTIDVNTIGTQPLASAPCKFLYQYITIPTSQGISNKEVDFVYLCPPQWSTPNNGYGSRDIKFVVTGPATFVSGSGHFDATLAIQDTTTSPSLTDLKIPVQIGYYFDTNNPVKPGFEMMTFASMTCS